MSDLFDYLHASLERNLARALFPPIERGQLANALARCFSTCGERMLGANAPRDHSLEPIHEGNNTLVRRWRTDQGETLFVRAWRYDRLVRPARSHGFASELLRGAGLEVPRVVLIEDSWRTLARFHIELAVETGAPGVPAVELIRRNEGALSPDLIETLAEQFGRLHRHSSSRWGQPWRPENRLAAPRRHWNARLQVIRAGVAGRTVLLTPEEVARGLDRLSRALEAVHLETPTLVHGDCSPAHIFISPSAAPDPFTEGTTDGGIIVPDASSLSSAPPWRCTWIDFGTVHYGHPAEDLSIFNHWPGIEDRIDRWREAYARALGRPLEGNLESALQAFEQLRAWEKLATTLRKVERHGVSTSRIEEARRMQRKIEARLRRRGFVA